MTHIQGEGFTVKVVKSSRRKSLALKVDHSGASIHMPRLMPMMFAKAFVKKKSAWIINKLEQQASRIPTKHQFIEGEIFLYLGKSYPLKLLEHKSKPSITLDNDSLNCMARLNKVSKNAISGAIITWYKQQANAYLKTRTAELMANTGLNAKTIQIKTYRARWGSCKINGDIQLNWKLIMAPVEIIDYVIIHELSHTVHHNHSPQFWQLVAQHCPDYKNAQQWLKNNGYRLEIST